MSPERGYIHIDGSDIEFQDSIVNVMISIVIKGNNLILNNSEIIQGASKYISGVPIGFPIPKEAPLFNIFQVSKIEFSNSIFRSNLTYFEIQDSNNVNIVNNEFNSNIYKGVDPEYLINSFNLTNLNFSNNTFDNHYYSISLSNSDSVDFSQNSGRFNMKFTNEQKQIVFRNNNLTGFLNFDKLENSKIKNNNITGSLSVNSLEAVLIENNAFTGIDAGDFGMTVFKLGSANNTIFQDNLFHSSHSNAFEITLSQNYNLTLKENHFISEYKSLTLNNPKGIILDNNIFEGVVDYFTFSILPEDGSTLNIGDILTDVYEHPFSYSWDGGELIVNATEIIVPSERTRHYLFLEIKDEFKNIIRENRTYNVFASMWVSETLNPPVISDEEELGIPFFVPNMALVAYGIISKKKRIILISFH